MPGIMAFIAPVFTRVVCSTVPLPSGFTLIRVELLMQAVSVAADAISSRTRRVRMGPPQSGALNPAVQFTRAFGQPGLSTSRRFVRIRTRLPLHARELRG